MEIPSQPPAFHPSNFNRQIDPHAQNAKNDLDSASANLVNADRMCVKTDGGAWQSIDNAISCMRTAIEELKALNPLPSTQIESINDTIGSCQQVVT